MISDWSRIAFVTNSGGGEVGRSSKYRFKYCGGFDFVVLDEQCDEDPPYLLTIGLINLDWFYFLILTLYNNSINTPIFQPNPKINIY